MASNMSLSITHSNRMRDTNEYNSNIQMDEDQITQFDVLDCRSFMLEQEPNAKSSSTSTSSTSSSISTSVSPSSFCSSSFSSSVSQSSQAQSKSPHEFDHNFQNANNHPTNNKLCLPTAEVPGGLVTTQNISTVIRPGPKGNYDPLQFVKIHTPELSKKAVEQIKLAEEVKITKDKIKEVEEEWQNSMLNWKSKRRQQMSTCNSTNDFVFGDDNSVDSSQNRRKIKTFAEMLEERAKAGARIGYDLHTYVESDEKQQQQYNSSSEDSAIAVSQNGQDAFELEQQMSAVQIAASATSDENDLSHTDTDSVCCADSVIGGTVMGVHFSDPTKLCSDYAIHNTKSICLMNDNTYEKNVSNNDVNERKHHSNQEQSLSSQNSDTNKLHTGIIREKYGRKVLHNHHRVSLSNEDVDSLYQSDALSSSPQHSSTTMTTSSSTNWSTSRQPDPVYDSNDEEIDDAENENSIQARYRQRKAFIQKLKAFESLSSPATTEEVSREQQVLRSRRGSQPLLHSSSTSLLKRDQQTQNQSMRPSRSELRIDCSRSNTSRVIPQQTTSLGSPRNRSLSMPRHRVNNLGNADEYKNMHNIQQQQQSNGTTITKIQVPDCSSVLEDHKGKSSVSLNIRDHHNESQGTNLSNDQQQPSQGLLIECSSRTTSESISSTCIKTSHGIKNEPMRIKVVSPNNGSNQSPMVQKTLSASQSVDRSRNWETQNFEQNRLSSHMPMCNNSNQYISQADTMNYITPDANCIDEKQAPRTLPNALPKTSDFCQLQESPSIQIQAPIYPMYHTDRHSQYNLSSGCNYDASKKLIFQSSNAHHHLESHYNQAPTIEPPSDYLPFEHSRAQISAASRVEKIPIPANRQPQFAVDAQDSSRVNSFHNNQGPIIHNNNNYPGEVASRPDSSNNNKTILSISGRKLCSSCGEELGRGCAAMVIESLSLYYHINCFRCSVCHVQLSNGFCGTDVRVLANALHCQNCYSRDGLNFSRV